MDESPKTLNPLFFWAETTAAITPLGERIRCTTMRRRAAVEKCSVFCWSHVILWRNDSRSWAIHHYVHCCCTSRSLKNTSVITWEYWPSLVSEARSQSERGTPGKNWCTSWMLHDCAVLPWVAFVRYYHYDILGCCCDCCRCAAHSPITLRPRTGSHH